MTAIMTSLWKLKLQTSVIDEGSQLLRERTHLKLHDQPWILESSGTVNEWLKFKVPCYLRRVWINNAFGGIENVDVS